MKQKSENKGKSGSNELHITQQSLNNISKDLSTATNYPPDFPRKKLSNEMVSLREKIQDELVDIERKIYELETFYWNQTTDIGNMLRGWDGHVTYNNTGSIGGRKSSIGGSRSSCRSTPNVFSEKDRWFSLSSVTSPVDLEALGTTPNTGAFSGEMFSAAGSNVGSSISYHSESQYLGSEADNSVNCSRKQRR